VKLLHLVNLNSTNIGNGALILGVERVLKEDWPEVEFIRLAWDDYTFCFKEFDQGFVDLVNSFDGLLIGAAVLFNGRSYLNHTGMRVNLPLELWEKIKKPIVFYGSSNMCWPYQKYNNLEKLKGTMNYILTNSKIIFSVRNDGTKEWLINLLGFGADRIEVIPDPAVFVPTADNFHPELALNRPNIIVSLNGEDEVYRFGGPEREKFWQENADRLDESKIRTIWANKPGWDNAKHAGMKHLADAIHEIWKKWHTNVILIPHYFDDFKLIADLIKYFPPSFPHREVVSSGMFRVTETEYFYDLYAKVNFVVSMRIHSMSPSIGLGTPMVALTTQSRMTHFLHDIGLENHGIDFFANSLCEDLIKISDQCLGEPKTIKEKLLFTTQTLRHKIKIFNMKVKLMFEGN